MDFCGEVTAGSNICSVVRSLQGGTFVVRSLQGATFVVRSLLGGTPEPLYCQLTAWRDSIVWSIPGGTCGGTL